MTRDQYPPFDQPALPALSAATLTSAAPSMLRALAGLLDALDHGEPSIGEAQSFARRVWDELTSDEPERQPDCAARLPQHLAGRLADLRAMLARDEPETGDDDLPGLYDYGLSSQVDYAIRVDLSTGGPADYITATVRHGEVSDARYHFADWFDHAERALQDDERETVADWLGTLFDLDGLSAYAESEAR